MEKQNIKNIIIILLIFVLGVSFYFYARQSNQNYIETETAGISQKNTNLQDSWVDGNYKYQVTRRMGEFYVVSATNNTPDCLDLSKVEDVVPCAGGGYYAKDGEEWVQSFAESLDCVKIVSLGFPKDFDNNISSCY